MTTSVQMSPNNRPKSNQKRKRNESPGQNTSGEQHLSKRALKTTHTSKSNVNKLSNGKENDNHLNQTPSIKMTTFSGSFYDSPINRQQLAIP